METVPVPLCVEVCCANEKSPFGQCGDRGGRVVLAWSKGVKKGVQCRMYGGVQLMRGTVLHAF
ncbi:hypothetical protein DVU_3211 [Nitratidesulfovibrio vulgaris str. Hildenborough]|uniref:Uncharacterized protein n=1 Tax=Nitratidesulfovibrio vulgaris (strain ATCC 29579 / DSM 644 / CCUG 34227 / NCIMB 8303 / VKM B-1760 / Hildenborough) TaxID=882 RepID=Q726E2_NITV2|nr:hypothetical protein DVU_3211 [Nitratidesulfovibrio vulgaris str. Hildenborough]